MIEEVTFIAADDMILAGYVDGMPFQILFSDIKPYWEYATEEDVEDGFVQVVDNKLLITLLTASSQGGVVILWNAETEEIEHISSGSYCIAVDIDDNKIYKLFNVYNYVVKPNLQVWEVPLDTMDPACTGRCLVKEIEPSVNQKNMGSSLHRLEYGFEIRMGREVCRIITVDLA